jgi:hypothetical protein
MSDKIQLTTADGECIGISEILQIQKGLEIRKGVIEPTISELRKSIPKAGRKGGKIRLWDDGCKNGRVRYLSDKEIREMEPQLGESTGATSRVIQVSRSDRSEMRLNALYNFVKKFIDESGFYSHSEHGRKNHQLVAQYLEGTISGKIESYVEGPVYKDLERLVSRKWLEVKGEAKSKTLVYYLGTPDDPGEPLSEVEVREKEPPVWNRVTNLGQLERISEKGSDLSKIIMEFGELKITVEFIKRE